MKCQRGPTIIFVPYPAQGHVTPAVKLASAFFEHGFEAVVITPEFIHNRITLQTDPNDRVSYMSIPDGLDKDTPRDFFAIEKAMENNMPIHLERLVRNLEENGGGIACMVVDLLASFAIKVANNCGIQVAGFWPVMFAAFQLIAAIPQMVRAGIISETGHPKHQGPISFLPGHPVLSSEDLPWLIGTFAARSSRFKFWTRTLHRSKNLQWLLANSHPEEESDDNRQQNYHQLIHCNDQDYPLIVHVGPLTGHAVIKSPTFWEEDRSCMGWLDQQHPGSVVYVSFGSWVSPIGGGKVRSLALALEATRRPFIWVLGPAWREGLPSNYLERVLSKMQGRVVSWAPQMEVLRHVSVGCYLTHCGWNSTLEAIQCKKPLLCYPLAGDQFVNCAYIVQVWRIGLQMRGFGEKDVEEGINRLMEDKEIKHRLMRLNESIMGKEASSMISANLTAFIEDLRDLKVLKSPLKDVIH